MNKKGAINPLLIILIIVLLLYYADIKSQPQNVIVNINSDGCEQLDFTVKSGDTITWVNQHGNTALLEFGEINRPFPLGPGAKYSITFNDNDIGEHLRYNCERKTGFITVVAKQKKTSPHY